MLNIMLFLGKAKQNIALGTIILMSLILGLMYLNLKNVKNQLKEEELKTLAFIQESEAMNAQVKQQLVEQQLASDFRLKQQEVIYQDSFKSIKAKYELSIKNQRVLIANNVELTRKLRDEVSANENALPDFSENPAEHADGWRERYTAIVGQYQTLRLACADTTNQFNQCRQILDEHCLIAECVR